MTAATHSQPATAMSHASRGVAGGIAGGLMFGLLMQMMDMIPMVAMLVGSESVAVGRVVHLAISAFIGATFGLLLGSRATTLITGVGYGTAYGIIWWSSAPSSRCLPGSGCRCSTSTPRRSAACSDTSSSARSSARSSV